MNPKSPFSSDSFESEFRSELLTHHSFMGSPPFQESFDSDFIAACWHAGRKIEETAGGQEMFGRQDEIHAPTLIIHDMDDPVLPCKQTCLEDGVPVD